MADGGGSIEYRDLGEILKSPLDKNQYKLIQLCSNGLKVLLISTLEEETKEDPRPPKVKRLKVDEKLCAFGEIERFNEKYLNIHQPPSNKNNSPSGQNAPLNLQNLQNLQNSNSNKYKSSEPIKGRGLEKKTLFSEDDYENIQRVSVCLAVGSGIMHDSDQVPGLAHFVEHCITLGSKKYPELEGLQTFLQANYGDNNAGTDPSHTFFSYYCDLPDVERSLDMFIDGFANTIFDIKRMEKELASLDSEFSSKKLEDDGRYLGLLQSFSIKNHPIGKFGFGCTNSIRMADKKELVKVVSQWKRMHYVAKNMAFAIHGPLTIKTLADLVVRYCKALPNCNCDTSPWNDIYQKYESISQTPFYPFDPSKWNRIYFVQPVLDGNWINLAWILPPEAGSNYKMKVPQFLGYIFTSKVGGSLDSYLRSRSWLVEITCNNQAANYLTTKFCTVFSIHLRLTDLGFANHGPVLKAVFSYVKMLQGIHVESFRPIFNELKQLHADAFHYRDEDGFMDPVNDFFLDDETVDVLRGLNELILDKTPPSDLLLAKVVTFEFNAHLLTKCLKCLAPKSANLVFESKKVDLKSAGFTLNQENWYGTKYITRSAKADADFLNIIDREAMCTEFGLPQRNGFVERGLCQTFDTHRKVALTRNAVFLNDLKAYVSYVNYAFGEPHFPMATYEIQFLSPKLYNVMDEEVCPSIAAWKGCLTYLLDVKLAQPKNALYSYTVDFGGEDDEEENEKPHETLKCSISGPTHKLPELFEILLKTIINLEKELSEPIYKVVVQTEKTNLNNLSMDSEKIATQLKRLLLEHTHYIDTVVANYLQRMSFDEFIDFTLASKNRMYLHVELCGSVTEAQGERVAALIRAIDYRPWKPGFEGIKRNRAVILPIGERCLKVKAHNKHEVNHVIINHYQIGILDDEEIEILETLASSLHSIAFEQLRSKEQLCYYVEVLKEKYLGIYGITIIMNTEAQKYTSDFVNERIDAFLEFYYIHIVEKRTKEFKDHLNELREKYYNWGEMKRFYEKYLRINGQNFRKISVHVAATVANVNPKRGTQVGAKVRKYASRIPLAEVNQDRLNENPPGYVLNFPANVNEENGYFITDLNKFKSNLDYYPNLE